VILDEGLFGHVALPEWTRGIILTPEVQRLREVRLINTSSPYIPALSDARRFTHTIGVAHLVARAIPRLQPTVPELELRSLLAASIVHDVGSPPFGHLFEYLLKSQTGWSHEAALSGILAGQYRPDNIYHQIYYGRPLSLPRAFAQAGVDAQLVARLVVGSDRLGPMLAGSIDFDNIDNVFRMTALLGIRPNLNDAYALADSLDIDGGQTVLHDKGLGALNSWRKLRRRAYEVLAFDVSALAGQAMLTDAISVAMETQNLSEEHWFWTDEELLRRLCAPNQPSDVRDPAQRFAVGDFYNCIGIFWYNQPQGARDLRLPAHRSALNQLLAQELGFPCSIYVFYDRGTFEKALSVRVKQESSIVQRSIGVASQSTIVSVFTPRRHVSKPSKYRAKVSKVLDAAGLSPALIKQVPVGSEDWHVSNQAQLPL
jgi:hypothetical protein